MTNALKTNLAHEVGARLSPHTVAGENQGALRMHFYIPEMLPERAPLVVVLHGGNQTAAEYALGAGWLALANRFGFALLCPEQTHANNSALCFNWFEPGDAQRDQGEAASIYQMVQSMLAEHSLSVDNVFITGLSAGAAMTAVMLATYPEVFSAGAMIAGLPYGAATNPWEAVLAMNFGSFRAGQDWGDRVRSASPQLAWPAVSIWHGSRDTTVRPSASNDLVRQWTNVHDVEGSPTSGVTEDGREYLIWCSADGRRKVEQHAIKGMAHGTPLKAAGADGCGQEGPYLLEVGISSSVEIANNWFE